MSPKELERDWLSLRCWLQRCVGPSAVVLLLTLLAFRLISEDTKTLDHNAVIVGFTMLYFILVRGGHMIMIRSLHKEMLRKYEKGYALRLAKLPRRGRKLFERRGNIGFTLAKIKRELIDEYGVR